MDNLRQIAILQLFYALNCLPTSSCGSVLVLSFAQKSMVVSLIYIAFVFVTYLVQRILLYYISSSINNNKIDKVSLSPINTDYVWAIIFFQVFSYISIQIIHSPIPEVNGNRYMKHELVCGVSLILDKVICE